MNKIPPVNAIDAQITVHAPQKELY